MSVFGVINLLVYVPVIVPVSRRIPLSDRLSTRDPGFLTEQCHLPLDPTSEEFKQQKGFEEPKDLESHSVKDGTD